MKPVVGRILLISALSCVVIIATTNALRRHLQKRRAVVTWCEVSSNSITLHGNFELGDEITIHVQGAP